MPAKKKRRPGLGLLAVGSLLVYAGYRWVTSHPVLAVFIVIVLAAAGITFATAVWRGRMPSLRRRPAALVDPHRMSPGEFENYLAELCVRDGCTRVRVVGGANDHGADVLYVDPRGRAGLIQAKRYAPGNSVGNEHVQIVNGTYRDAHGCQHAAIVTTSHFTQAAQAFAKRVGIRLLDDTRLDLWARGYETAAPWN